jgi:hypothetical protein
MLIDTGACQIYDNWARLLKLQGKIFTLIVHFFVMMKVDFVKLPRYVETQIQIKLFFRI